MDFNLSREHQLIRKMMAEFTEKEVKPISKFQNTQFTLADMELGCEAGCLLTYQAAVAKGEVQRIVISANMGL